ncbi:unnamed protein product [Ectocarpus sp. 4 AP-2014]
MSSPPAAEASGSAGASSAVGTTPYRQCRGKDCRPPGPAPSPEPRFHSHWWNRETGQDYEAFWGNEFGAAALRAAEAIAAPGFSSSGKRRGKKFGGRRDDIGEAAAALSTPTEQKDEEGHEEPATCEPQPRQPTLPALPAQPAQGVEFPAPVVPVWKLLEAANGSASTSVTEEMAARQMLAHQQMVNSSVPVGRLVAGRSVVQGFGVFAAMAIGAQMVVTEFTGQHISEAVADKRVAAYQRSGQHGYVVQLGGDSMYVDLMRGGFPARLVNHSCEPNTYLHTVTAGMGDSEETRIFLFSLRRIAVGEEIVYSYPAPGSLDLGPAFSDECTCGAPICCGIMDNCDDILERMNSIDWHTAF